MVYSTVYSDADHRKHQSSASLAFVRGIHRGPVNSPHKWPVTRKMFPFDDVIMSSVPLAFVKRILRWPETPFTKVHKGPVTRKIIPFDDFIMVKHSRISPGWSSERLLEAMLPRHCWAGYLYLQNRTPLYKKPLKSTNHDMYLSGTMCVNLSGSLIVGYFCPCVCSSYWGYFDPYSNVHVANMGPTWILSAPCGPHYVGPINLAIRVIMCEATHDTVIVADAIAPYPVTETDPRHYGDVIMSAKASQITGGVIVYSTVCSGPDQRKHQSSPLLAFVRGIHRRVNSPRKGPVTRKMFLFDDVIMSIFIWAVSVTMWTCSGKDGTFYVSFICDIAMDKTSVFFPIQLPEFFNCFLSTFLQNVQNTDLEKKGVHWNIYKHAINENCFSVYVIGVFFMRS